MPVLAKVFATSYPVAVERMWAQTLQTWVCHHRPGQSRQSTVLSSTLPRAPRLAQGLLRAKVTLADLGPTVFSRQWSEVPDTELPPETYKFLTLPNLVLLLPDPEAPPDHTAHLLSRSDCNPCHLSLSFSSIQQYLLRS